MGEVIPFSGEYYTKERKADDICEELTCELVESMKTKYGFNTSNPEFLINIAWLIKFMEVIIADEMGLANKLSKELKVI